VKVEIVKADYSNEVHESEIQTLLDSYAADPMGGGHALPGDVVDRVVKELRKIPQAFSLIGYVDSVPVSLANCFEGFSTFSCKPLINIHDLFVLEGYRGNGIGQRMLQEVEKIAESTGCCKITLEVLGNNEVAKSSYLKFGFSDYDLGPTLFWQKKLRLV